MANLLPWHSYQLDESQASSARLLNCYAEAAPESGKGPYAVRLAPGVEYVPEAPFSINKPGRGLLAASDGLYFVAGDTMYRYAGPTSVRALVPVPGTGPAFLVELPQQIVIVVPGEYASSYSKATGSSLVITDPDVSERRFGPAARLDNFALFVDEASGQFFASDVGDATSFQGLNFATPEVSPDKLKTIITTQNRALLLSEQSGEWWYNAGTAGFPFVRVPGGTFDVGTYAKFGACVQNNVPYFFAADGTFRTVQGSLPVRISQHGVEQKVARYSRTDDCEAFPFTYQGHQFVAFTFPAAGATWVYDVTTAEWHERQSYGTGRWNVASAVSWRGQTYVQHATTGRLGILSPSTFTEWGETLRWEATTQGVQSIDRQVYGPLQASCEVGVGLVTGQGSDPRVTLEISNDGGRTFYTAPTRSLGAIGRYQTRVRWERMGSAFHRVLRLSGSDPVPFVIWNLDQAMVR